MFSATLDGVALASSVSGNTWTLTQAEKQIAAGAHSLIISGQALPGLQASYNIGSITSVAVPIPEPGTYALMLAGLGALGFVASRRKSA